MRRVQAWSSRSGLMQVLKDRMQFSEKHGLLGFCFEEIET